MDTSQSIAESLLLMDSPGPQKESAHALDLEEFSQTRTESVIPTISDTESSDIGKIAGAQPCMNLITEH